MRKRNSCTALFLEFVFVYVDVARSMIFGFLVYYVLDTSCSNTHLFFRHSPYFHTFLFANEKERWESRTRLIFSPCSRFFFIGPQTISKPYSPQSIIFLIWFFVLSSAKNNSPPQTTNFRKVKNIITTHDSVSLLFYFLSHPSWAHDKNHNHYEKSFSRKNRGASEKNTSSKERKKSTEKKRKNERKKGFSWKE